MKADFSRISFDPAQQFSAVLHQQGRVLTDADCNEQTAIHAHMYESLAASLTGTEGAIWMEPTRWRPLVARHLPGFCIVPVPGQGNIAVGESPGRTPGRTTEGQQENPFGDKKWWISPGHYYVDGLRVENEAWVPVGAQPFLPDSVTQVPKESDTQQNRTACLFYLDVWERPLSWLDDARLSDVALGGTVDTAQRAQIVWQVKRLDLEELKQVEESTDGAADAKAGDTTGFITAESTLSALTARVPWLRRKPRLRVRIRPDAVSADPCRPALASAYQGQENQLYRVEIHDGSPVETTPPAPPPAQDLPPVKYKSAMRAVKGQTSQTNQTGQTSTTMPPSPTFKWSRENGSVAAKITRVSGDRVTVFPGQLKAGGFRKGDRVELVRNDDELAGKHGGELTVAKVQGDTLTFEPTEEKLTLQPGDKLRRWDQHACEGWALAVAHEWVELEHGIEVLFEPAVDEDGHEHTDGPDCFAQTDFRTGDYWTFTARTATGAVDWPLERADTAFATLGATASHTGLSLLNPFGLVQRVPVRCSGQPPQPEEGAGPAALPPHGVRHRYALLARAQYDPRRKGWHADDMRRILHLCDAVPSRGYIATDFGIRSEFSGTTIVKEEQGLIAPERKLIAEIDKAILEKVKVLEKEPESPEKAEVEKLRLEKAALEKVALEKETKAKAVLEKRTAAEKAVLEKLAGGGAIGATPVKPKRTKKPPVK